jgi:hypothetical protein
VAQNTEVNHEACPLGVSVDVYLCSGGVACLADAFHTLRSRVIPCSSAFFVGGYTPVQSIGRFGPAFTIWTLNAAGNNTFVGQDRAFQFAYKIDPASGQGFTGGVRVGIENRMGQLQVVTGPGPGGGPNVRTFGVTFPARPPATITAVDNFFAYDSSIAGGLYVAGSGM